MGLDRVRWRDTEDEDSGIDGEAIFLEPTGPFLMPGEAPPEEALALFRVPPPLPLGTRPSWPAPVPPEPEAGQTDPDETDPDEIGDDAIVIEQVAVAHGVAAGRSSWKSLAIAFAAGVFAGAVMVMTVTG